MKILVSLFVVGAIAQAVPQIEYNSPECKARYVFDTGLNDLVGTEGNLSERCAKVTTLPKDVQAAIQKMAMHQEEAPGDYDRWTTDLLLMQTSAVDPRNVTVKTIRKLIRNMGISRAKVAKAELFFSSYPSLADKSFDFDVATDTEMSAPVVKYLSALKAKGRNVLEARIRIDEVETAPGGGHWNDVRIIIFEQDEKTYLLYLRQVQHNA